MLPVMGQIHRGSSPCKQHWSSGHSPSRLAYRANAFIIGHTLRQSILRPGLILLAPNWGKVESTQFYVPSKRGRYSSPQYYGVHERRGRCGIADGPVNGDRILVMVAFDW